ncbi:MAG: twin-arginine translocation signal domain-containing protein, partial [Dysgonamonadaceae bacterium]|nr:twin-arginine translocation signal domain-containing protein [Dysgonamonadaceae bacterium]
MENISRRELLKRTAIAVGGALLLNRPIHIWAMESSEATSRVVLIRNQKLYAGGDTPDVAVCEQMIDEAVCRLTGLNTPKEAWASIIKPSDIVGIKTNQWNGLPTPPCVNDALKARVLSIGVAEDKVSVDDRGVKQNPVFQQATALINTRPMRTHAWSGVG